MTGSFNNPVVGTVELRGGQLNGKKLTFTVTVVIEGQSMDATFAADVEGNKMDGTIALGGVGTLPFSGTRPQGR